MPMPAIAQVPASGRLPASSKSGSFAPRDVDATPRGRTRLLYGDPLRVFGSLAVVATHLCTAITENTEAVGTSRWWQAALCDGATRWAVPAFLMLSGALLLEPVPGETTALFYRKRLKRLAYVCLFWPLFYQAWAKYYLHETVTPRSVLRDFVLAEPYYHLHFLFALPGLYFLTPMLRVYTRHAARRQFRLLTIVVLGVTVLAGGIQEIRGLTLDLSSNTLTRFLPYLGYYLGGYALRDVVLSRRGLLLAAAGLATSIILYAVGTSALVRLCWPHSFAFYFLTQYSLSRILGGISVFLLLATLFQRGIRWPFVNALVARWLALAPSCLGIYLIHPIFIDLFKQVDSGITSLPLWLSLPATWIGVWTASLGTTLLLRRVPYLGRIVG
jgi:surface polysaccharide O-acyltransferase-like enzyme